MTSKLGTTVARLKNVPGIGQDLITTLGLAVLGVAAVAYLLIHDGIDLPGQSKYRFAAEFDQAPAIQLAARQEVRIAGVTVGKITGDSVASDGTAKVDFEIDPGHPVYKNARVVLSSKTPINIMYATLNPGTPSAGLLGDGGVIPVTQTSRVTQPYELLNQLDERTRAALTSLVDESAVALADAPRQLPGDLVAVKNAAASFKPVVEALAQRRENLRRVVTSLSQIATAAGSNNERLARLAADLETTLSVVSQRDSQLGSALNELPGLTDTLRSSMTAASSLTSQLSPTLDSLIHASGRLPQVLGDLNTTVGLAQTVVQEATPVVAKALPVVQNLAPLADDLHSALTSLTPVANNLPTATARLTPWLDNLGAFIYNTASSFSLGDANGGLGRANLIVKLYQPTGGGL